MRTLIVEDEPTSATIIQEILSVFGDCILCNDGNEAIDLFKQNLIDNTPFDLICMDIMMPELDGQEALKKIRALESKHEINTANKVKVIMTTALEDQKNVIEAFYKGGAASYIVKPINKQKLLDEIRKLGLIE